LIKLTTKHKFIWQINVIGVVLKNTEHSQGTYPLLMDLINKTD